MKKIILPVLLMSLTVFAALTISAADFGARGALKADDLTLSDMLTFAIQDEYLARAEYEKIIQEYGPVRPFINIVKAEEMHIGYLIPLFEKYGYNVPEDSANDHVVIPQDIKTALEIGVNAEIENIAMYESFLEKDLPEDVRVVFEKLQAASENHLRAFNNGLRRY